MIKSQNQEAFMAAKYISMVFDHFENSKETLEKLEKEYNEYKDEQ